MSRAELWAALLGQGDPLLASLEMIPVVGLWEECSEGVKKPQRVCVCVCTCDRLDTRVTEDSDRSNG